MDITARDSDVRRSSNPTGSAADSWRLQPGKGALTEEQVRQLDVLFAQILHADPARGMPGAVDAGASRFVSLLLGRDGSVYEEIPDWQARYPVWLTALDAHARANRGRALVDLGGEDVQALLSALETGTLAGLDAAVDQKLAFKTFHRHCIQGCFSDPRWGGNRDGIVWRWLGYPHAPNEVR